MPSEPIAKTRGRVQFYRIGQNYALYATALFFLLALQFPFQSAFAQSPSDVAAARELFIEGTRLAEKGQWKEARDHFERSLRLKPASITLYSLGVAQRQTEQWVEARESFNAFLAEPSSQATQPFEKPARDAIADLNKSIPILRIEVIPSHLTDLHLEMDGRPFHAAMLGYPRPVNPGLHSISAGAKGYKTAFAQVVAKAGEETAAKLRLELLKNSGGNATSPSPPPAPERALPLVLMGSGLATSAAGIATGIGGYVDADINASAGRTKMIMGGVLGGLGLLSAGVGLVIWIGTSPQNSSAQASKTQRPFSLHPSGISFHF